MKVPVEPRYTEYLHTKAVRAGIPLNGTFELTPCCNMACRMCYVRLTKQQQEAIAPLRTAREWIELGRRAKEHGMLYLLLTGGEPFLRPDFREILSALHEMGLIISINSNGTLIDEETVTWLKETPPTRINITLYGASDETYDRLCGNPRGFTQVTRAIRLLKEAGISVKLNCSVTPHNAQDLDAMFAFAEREELVIQATSYMFPPMRRDESMVGKNDRFTAQEAAYYSARISCLMSGEADFLERMEHDAPPVLSADVGEDCPVLPAEADGMRCRAGKCSFWVTWEGRLLPCGMFPSGREVNVFEADFLQAWQGVRQMAASIRVSPKCSSCQLKDACRTCAAMAMAETGEFSGTPRYRCDMATGFPVACRTLEAQLRAAKKTLVQEHSPVEPEKKEMNDGNEKT